VRRLRSARASTLAAAVDRLIDAKEWGRERGHARAHRPPRRPLDGRSPRLTGTACGRWPPRSRRRAQRHPCHPHRIELRAIAKSAALRAARRGTGRPPASFAYPNGNASPALARAVRDAGFALAVVTDEAPDPGCPPDYAIRRKNLALGSSHGLTVFSAAIFACEVLGLFEGLRRRSRRSPR
jgi:hypothetical protein